jgi:spectinomycin phosphotransferase
LENTVETSREKICLCHGDINTGNLLFSENDLYIVDWDTLVLASREKDLMYIGGGIGNKWNDNDDIEYFYKGYGNERRSSVLRVFKSLFEPRNVVEMALKI